MRIRYKIMKYQGEKPPEKLKTDILQRKEMLRSRVEREIKAHLSNLRRYLRSPGSDPHLSLEEIYRKREPRSLQMFDPFVKMVKRMAERRLKVP